MQALFTEVSKPLIDHHHPLLEERASMGTNNEKLRTYAFLLTCLIIVAGMRVLTYGEALERDIAIHATIGNELLHGRLLYIDLWDNKPPLSYLIHAFMIYLFGFGDFYIYIINVACNYITLLGIYFFTRLLDVGRFSACMVCIFYLLVSFDMNIEANQPNTEVLANSLLVWGVALWMVALEKNGKFRYALLSSLLLGLTTLLKQHYVLILLFIAGGSILKVLLTRKEDLRLNIVYSITLVAITTSIWTLVLIITAAQGSISIFIDTIFGYVSGYGFSDKHFLRHLLPIYAIGILPYLIFTLAVFLIRGWLKESRTFILFFWLIGTYISVLAPGRFYPHYYQLLIPPTLVGSALFLNYLQGGQSPVRRVLLASCITSALLFSLLRTIDFVSHKSHEWSELKYPGAGFAETKTVGLSLGNHLAPGELVFYLGPNASLFLYGQLRSANSDFYVDHLTQPSILREVLLNREIDNFNEKSFHVAIFDRSPLLLQTATRNIFVKLFRDYIEVPSCFNESIVLVHRNSHYLPTLSRDLISTSSEKMRASGLDSIKCLAN
jgi:hypothetical protein